MSGVMDLRGWQTYPNGSAVIDDAGNFQFAFMGLDDVLDDRQAQSGAAKIARACLVDAVEALRQARQILLRDARAGVGDGNFDLSRSFMVMVDHRGPKRNLAAGGRVL